MSTVCARRGLFSVEAVVAARAENRKMKVINSPKTGAKKAEGKKRRSPCTPFREKAKGKENDRRVLSRNRLSRMGARVRTALDADLDAAMRAFKGSEEDRRIWAAIAWRVGVEAFHFALMDKLAEDAADGTQNIRSQPAAFQAFLNERFPKNQPSPRPLRGKGGAA